MDTTEVSCISNLLERNIRHKEWSNRMKNQKEYDRLDKKLEFLNARIRDTLDSGEFTSHQMSYLTEEVDKTKTRLMEIEVSDFYTQLEEKDK